MTNTPEALTIPDRTPQESDTTILDLLHEMLTMLAQIRDELRQIRQVLPSTDVEALVALHRRLRAPDEAD